MTTAEFPTQIKPRPIGASLLRVKIIGLLDEMKTIQREIKRAKRQPDLQDKLLQHWSLLHAEIRPTLLAMGFIRGLRWTDMESPATRTMFNEAEVYRLVRKYGSFNGDQLEEFSRVFYEIRNRIYQNRVTASKPRPKHPHLPGTRRAEFFS